jgi:GTP-binding protein
MAGLQSSVVNPFERATYVASAHDLGQMPPEAGLEVAFAGRSNAGKSSALNTLAGRNRLAFVSKTPGRTQLVNFFSVAPERFLVDLPGYGYAKVPEKERLHWRYLVGGYLQNRAALCGLVSIMDIRHPLTPLDENLLAYFLPTGRPIHVLLTKADKLGRQQAIAQLASVRKALSAHGKVTVQLFSSLKRTGVEEAREVLGAWLGLATTREPAL